MESERAQNFQDRLNQWIASQGFWFQLKYSMSGKGMAGSTAFHVLQLFFRLLVFVVLIGVGGMFYLFNRTDGEPYRKKMEEAVLADLNSKEGQLQGLRQAQGKLSIAKFSAVGKDDAFFRDMDVRSIGAKMAVWNGLVGNWETGVMTIGRLDIDLRAGTTDAALAKNLGQVLFRNRPKLDIAGFDSEETTVSWGYSPVTSGMIEKSHMRAMRSANGWRLVFRSGKFSQNWIKGLDIEEVVVVCHPDGVTVEKALFRKNGGTLDMSGLRITGAEKPVVTGTARFRNLPMEVILPPLAGTMIEGAISGDFRVSGSTNSVEGIAFEGKVDLREGDVVSLRDRIHLLKALKGVDVFNNYRRVEFRTGSFIVRSGKGSLSLEDVNLRSDDTMTLTGNVKARPPTEEETKILLPMLGEEKSLVSDEEKGPKKSGGMSAMDFSLKQAEVAAREAKGNPNKQQDRYDERLKERKAAETRADQLADIMKYEGEFELSLRPEVFEKSAKLVAEYPVDGKSGRIHVKVPVSGQLGILTLKLAEDIYQKGRER